MDLGLLHLLRRSSVAIVHGCQPLITITTTTSVIYAAAALDLPLQAGILYNSQETLNILQMIK